ncbi:MAG: type II toxin-antitoxin system PemK/MazF family toxin [Clostridia bacterium]|nr:type II toxin-antitoxin system PemK/MazF family toxin [Clostridia bacterium]
MKVNRGEIWLVNLNPVIGHEQAGTRPILIISENMFNHSLAKMVIVIPITSKNKGIPTHVELKTNFLPRKSYLKTEDVRSISTQRLIKKLGDVENTVISLVEERLKLLLGFM